MPSLCCARNDTWSTEVIQAVIGHGGIDVNSTNKKHVTALMIACEKGNKDAINVLLNAGADPNNTDADGDTCLHYAARKYWSTEVIQAVTGHGGHVNSTNKKHVTALMIACKKGSKDAINVLLNAGADPNNTDADGDTCLHYAARKYWSTEVIQAVIGHGGHVNSTNKKHVTALMIACKKGSKDAINVLLNAGADPNNTDADGDICLHYAARKYWPTEVIQAVIGHGGDVNSTNKKNVTALMIACENGHKDAINVLFNAGADPNITDDVGATCIYHAVLAGCYKDVLEAIVNHGADVNVTNKNNKTALMVACDKGNKDAINVLLNAGADPNIIDGVGATCIYHAVLAGCNKDVLETIVNHGADVNVTNQNNKTVLMIACGKGNKDAIDVLLNAGADPNIADANGWGCHE